MRGMTVSMERVSDFALVIYGKENVRGQYNQHHSHPIVACQKHEVNAPCRVCVLLDKEARVTHRNKEDSSSFKMQN